MTSSTMDRNAWILWMFLCLCVACYIHGTRCAENPRLFQLGVPYKTDPALYTKQDTSGDLLFIPDGDFTFPTQGKLLDFSFWFNSTYPSCSVKIATLNRSPTAGIYIVNAVSEIFNKGAFGWNHITFDLKESYLPIETGDTIGMIFYYYNYLLFSEIPVGQENCTTDRTMEAFSTNFYSLDVNDTFKSVPSSNCRSYMYQGNYIPDGVCLNSTVETENKPLDWNPHRNSADTMCWNMKAAPSGSGENMVVKAVFTTAIVNENGVVIVSDADGKTLKEIRHSANTSIGEDIYSFTDTMNINFKSPMPTNAESQIVIELFSIPKSKVPSGYYCSLPNGGLCPNDIIIIIVVVVILILIIVLVISGIICVRAKKKNNTNPN